MGYDEYIETEKLLMKLNEKHRSQIKWLWEQRRVLQKDGLFKKRSFLAVKIKFEIMSHIRSLKGLK